MPRDFFPRREAEIVTWSKNFREKILAAPQEYSLSELQAEQYSVKHEAFAAVYQTTKNPTTRTPSSIFLKHEAREALEAEARMLARIVRASPAVTDAQRMNLGLSAPRAGRGTPIGAPDRAPSARIVSVSGRTVRLRLRDADAPTNRGKPRGAAGAAIFTYIGDQPPAGRADWSLQCHASRTTVDVTFGPAVEPGAKVYLAACWLSPRGQSGPVSMPLAAYVGYAGPAFGSLVRAA